MILDGFEYHEYADIYEELGLDTDIVIDSITPEELIEVLSDKEAEIKTEYDNRFRKYWRLDVWSGTGTYVIDDQTAKSEERKMTSLLNRVRAEIERLEEICCSEKENPLPKA